VRPFVSEMTARNKAHWWGYLNASEIQAMEASGLVDVQSHAKTHTWYETGQRWLVDMENPMSSRHGCTGIGGPPGNTPG